MNILQNKSYDCDKDIEEYIKELEIQYKIDIKSLPQWRNIIERINFVKTECKKKLINAKKRKFQIMEKLYIENYRTSPFELTDNFARTAKLWKEIKFKVKQRKTSSIAETSSMSLYNVSFDNIIANEQSAIESNAHPNSEVIQSENPILKQDVEPDSNLSSPHYLPPVICTNQHKVLSSIGSDEVCINYKESKNIKNDFKSETTEEFVPNQSKLAKFYPEEITISNNTMNEQTLKFTLLNCSTEYIHTQYKNLSDTSYFKTFRVFPLVPFKLNPGLSKNYKLKFTLRENINVNDISSLLNVRIRSKNIEEILCVPITGRYTIKKSVIVTDTVNIPQVYLWQVKAKCGYPKGIVQIQVCDSTSYSLYIRKNNLNFIKESEDAQSTDSIKVITPNTESLMRKVNDDEIETQDKMILSTTQIENKTLTSFDIITLVLNDILNLVYEPFVFKNTYLRLSPKSKRIVLVYFTKAEHIGYHQCYYDFIFIDSDDTFFTKTIKVFAEILPHPILIYPNIHDMIKSPVEFGRCEDYFTITNTLKAYPVSITIKTTSKMNKIFQITPRVVSIPAKSNVNFNIKLCKEQINASENEEIMAYFTIKIIVSGHKSVYQNVPPFYYEIIAPCTKEYIKTYQTKYIEYIEDENNELNPVNAIQND